MLQSMGLQRVRHKLATEQQSSLLVYLWVKNRKALNAKKR